MISNDSYLSATFDEQYIIIRRSRCAGKHQGRHEELLLEMPRTSELRRPSHYRQEGQDQRLLKREKQKQ